MHNNVTMYKYIFYVLYLSFHIRLKVHKPAIPVQFSICTCEITYYYDIIMYKINLSFPRYVIRVYGDQAMLHIMTSDNVPLFSIQFQL